MRAAAAVAYANITSIVYRASQVAENEDIMNGTGGEWERVSPSIMNCGRISQNGGHNPPNNYCIFSQRESRGDGKEGERGAPYPERS
eukprot:scaffold3456_cov78-Skeletonema_dohrnii-CCMP3373.AAC.2